MIGMFLVLVVPTWGEIFSLKIFIHGEVAAVVFVLGWGLFIILKISYLIISYEESLQMPFVLFWTLLSTIEVWILKLVSLHEVISNSES
jgi:hypothetical protein